MVSRRDFLKLSGAWLVGLAGASLFKRKPPKKRKKRMQIQHDKSANSGLQTTQSYDFDLTTTVDQNKYPGLVVGVQIFGAGSVSSVSVEGINLKFINEHHDGNYRAETWHLLAVPLAAGAITVTVTLSGTMDSISGASYYSYYGGVGFLVGSAGPDDVSGDVITTQPDSMVFANLCTQATSGVTDWAPAYPQNNRWDVPSASGTAMAADKGPYPLVGEEVQIGFSNIGPTNTHAFSAVELLSYVPAPPAIMGL